MPPDPLPFDRKDFLKDRNPLSVDPVGIVPQRWREPATTSSQHNNHGSFSSCRWGGGGGLSDFHRPFSGLHGKRVGGGWHHTTVESGSNENSCLTNSVSMAFGSQKDPKGANCWETTASPNGNSLPHNDFVKSSDQLQSVDQHAKNSGGGGSSTTNNNQILEKASSLGSSLDWKPLKWIRSGSLQQLGNKTPLRSLSEDAAPCVTPRTPDEVSSRKKQRLGWGEGLAKYEKKKVDPADDIVDKDVGGVVDGVTGSEPLLASLSNLSDKSPSVNGNPECASPTTPYSFACSSSPGGLEEKESSKTFTVDNDTCDPSAVSCHLSENHTEELSFSLGNLEHGLSSSLEELVQSDDSSCPGRSGFVKSSTAMDKLQVWKTELTKTLEITETGIDSLENELKSLVSDGGSCPFTPASSNKTYEKNCEPLAVEKTDSCPEEVNGVEDPGEKSPGTTSELMEPAAKYSEDIGNDGMSGFELSLGDGSEVPTGSSSTISDGRREDKFYDMISASNKVISSKASDELGRMLLPTTAHLCTTNISKAATDELLIKKRIGMRNRFLKLKERVVTSKYRALRYSWKEDVHLLSRRKSSAKSSHSRKFESSSRMGYADNQKCRPPGGGGGLSLVPTAETLDYVEKLLSDSRVRRRSALKMPCLKLDRRERLMTRFDSDNGLVEDPVGIEKERCVVSSWTEKEKEIFLDKYCLFGKDFKKIASFLEYRTTGDCVEFYYKNHKSDRFQNTKKKSAFAKGKSCGNNTSYLVTPSAAAGRRLNCEGVAASLEMLGAAAASASAMVDGQQQSRPIYHDVGTCNDKREGDLAMLCNEQETAAADVLAGICGSMISEALGCCITSSVDHGRRRQQNVIVVEAVSSLNGVDEETCWDDSCGEDEDEDVDVDVDGGSFWTDEEKVRFIKAFRSEGKDFLKMSRRMRTKTADECRVFFSKARKCLGLDGSESEGGDDDGDGGSDISHDKSSVECSKMDKLVENNKMELVNVNNLELEGAADSEATRNNNTCCQGLKVEAPRGVGVGAKICREISSSCPSFDDVVVSSEKEEPGNGLLLVSSKFSPSSRGDDSTSVEDRADDVSSSSSKLTFRRRSCDNKTYERSRDLNNLVVPKHSLLESSCQLLRGYPVTADGSLISYSETPQSNLKLIMDARRNPYGDVEKARGGDVKLFGQILTKGPPQEEERGGDRRKVVVVDDNVSVVRSSRWSDGNIIRIGVQSVVPDSARLLAKYPAAFTSKTPSSSSSTFLHNHHQLHHYNNNNNNNAAVVVEPFTVDNLLSTISDPVAAAIRMHYEQYENAAAGSRNR